MDCKPGYFGKFCNLSCPSGRFGARCGGVCYPTCFDSECDHVQGCLKNTVTTIQTRNKETVISTKRRGFDFTTEFPEDVPFSTENEAKWRTFQSHKLLKTTRDYLVDTENYMIATEEPMSRTGLRATYLLIGLGVIIIIVLFLILIQLHKKSNLFSSKVTQTTQSDEVDTTHESIRQNTHVIEDSYIPISAQNEKDRFYQPLESEYLEIVESMQSNFVSLDIYETPISSGNNPVRFSGTEITIEKGVEETGLKEVMSNLYC